VYRAGGGGVVGGGKVGDGSFWVPKVHLACITLGGQKSENRLLSAKGPGNAGTLNAFDGPRRGKNLRFLMIVTSRDQ